METIKNKFIYKFLLVSFFVMTIFTLGMLSSHYNCFIYKYPKKLYKNLFAEPIHQNNTVVLNHKNAKEQKSDTIIELNKDDIEKYNMIDIKSEKDILRKRKELINYIWKKQAYPLHKLPIITKNTIDNKYSEIEDIKQINKLEVVMEYNVNSIMYHFEAAKPNKKIMIYHQGHLGDFYNGINTIREFIKNGYDVIAISMPLLGMNNQPEIEIERFGKMKFVNHNQFAFLDNNKFSAIKFFIEPVITAINYAESLNFKNIYMTGISGGGWTTVLTAALDNRVSKNYSVAGSYPLFVRYKYQTSFGDYEQVLTDLYRTVNYLELYILGGYGNSRKFVQIFNLNDPCCFSGYYFRSYENIIKEKNKLLGKGNFTIFTDSTHTEHIISKTTMKYILDDLKQ